MPESDIQRKILNWIRTQPQTWAVKYPGGIFGQTGTPDILICRHGRMIALEVKTSEGKLTKLQQRTMTQIVLAGGTCEVVRNVQDVINLFQRIDNELAT
jgi:hypothetical protein